MDTSAELVIAATDLEELATGLYAIDRDLTGRASERPTHELARSTAYWMIALRRLATTGRAAFAAIDEYFPRDPEDGPAPAYSASEGPAELISELDVISTFVIGDMVLEDLAYAELVFRDRLPSWNPGIGRIPTMWPAFVDVVEEMAPDPMLADARYLDLTLAHGRDVLVAHRDPTLSYVPGFSSWGEVTLSRVSLDQDRLAAALEALRAVDAALRFPSGYGMADDYRILGDYLLAIAGHLDRDSRNGVRVSYRAAGFESPNVIDMVRPAVHLIGLHLAKLRAIDGA